MLGSKKFHSYLGLAVSLALLAWIGFVTDWSQIGTELAKVNLWGLIPLTLILVGQLLLRAMRWRYLLPLSAGVPLRSLFDSSMIGNLATFLLPLRAGEFIRPFVLARQGQYSFATAFASVVVERFFDLSAVLATFGVLAFALPVLPSWATKGAMALAVLALGILVFVFVGVFWPNLVKAITRRGVVFLPDRISSGVIKFSDNLLHAVEVLRQPRNVLLVLLYTGLIWGVTYLGFGLGLWMFGQEFDLVVGTTVGVILALAVAAPSAPGFIGVFQTGCIAALLLFSYSEEFGVAYSVVLHAHQYLLTIAIGAFCLARQGLSFKSLSHGTQVAPASL